MAQSRPVVAPEISDSNESTKNPLLKSGDVGSFFCVVMQIALAGAQSPNQGLASVIEATGVLARLRLSSWTEK